MAHLQYNLPDSKDAYFAKVSAPSSRATCGVLLGHGAGGDSESGHLPKIAQALSEAGLLCVRFDCKPPNLAKRVAHAEACLLAAQQQYGVKTWLAAGHSMGARVASSLAHTQPELVVAAIFFSYPLHPPGKLEQLRDNPLVDLRQPVIFIHGTKDNFCDEAQFKAVLKRMFSKRRDVYNVEGGDHGLKTKGGKAAAESAITRAINAAVTFAQEFAGKVHEEEIATSRPPSSEPETGVRRSKRPRQAPKQKGEEAPEETVSTPVNSQKRKKR